MLATHASAFRAAAEKLLPASGIYTPAPRHMAVLHPDQQCWGQGLTSRQSQCQMSQVATSKKPHKPTFGVQRVGPLPLSQLWGPL